MTADSPSPSPARLARCVGSFLFNDTFPYRTVGFNGLGYNRANDASIHGFLLRRLLHRANALLAMTKKKELFSTVQIRGKSVIE